MEKQTPCLRREVFVLQIQSDDLPKEEQIVEVIDYLQECSVSGEVGIQMAFDTLSKGEV